MHSNDESTFLFQLNVTRRCNLRCTHCYIDSDKKDVSPDWTPEEFFHVIDGICEYLTTDYNGPRKYSRAEVHVIGGEPSELGIPFFSQVLGYASSAFDALPHEIELSIVTNLLTPTALEVARMFDTVSTSFEIATRFNKPKQQRMWESNVRTLFQEISNIPDRKLAVTCAAVRPTVDYGAENLLNYLFDLGFRHMHLGFFIPSGDGLKNMNDVAVSHEETSQFYIDSFDWYLKKRSEVWLNPMEGWIKSLRLGKSQDDVVCPIVSGALDIDGDGNTISCIEKGGELDYDSIGNLFERNDGVIASDAGAFSTTVSDILDSPAYLVEVAKANSLNPVCRSCEYQQLCVGNCGVLHGYWDESGECPGFKKFIDYVRTNLEKHDLQVR